MESRYKVTGSSALSHLQKEYPDTWQDIIFNARAIINAACRKYKLPQDREGYAMAIQYSFKCNSGYGAAITLIAAAYIMAKQQRITKCHVQYELSALRIQKQQAALTVSNWPEDEKILFARFYKWRLEVIEHKISALITESHELAKNLGRRTEFSEEVTIRKGGHDGRNRGGIIKA
jgi:hypothetical protein